MIKYFDRKLNMIYSSKLALAKENYEKNSAEILAEHHMLAQEV